MVVDNRPGAGNTIAASIAARAAPDGYTLHRCGVGDVIAPALYRKLSYNAIDSFEPIGLVTDVPMTLVARKDFPAKDFKELLTYLKANAVDLTPRVASTITENGIDFSKAEVPPGEHAVKVTVKDVEGRETNTVIKLNVVK